MVRSVLVNCAMQLALQSLPMDMRLLFTRPGTACALVVMVGSVGMGNCMVCVERSCVPLGIQTMTALLGQLLCACFGWMKWALHPVLANQYGGWECLVGTWLLGLMSTRFPPHQVERLGHLAVLPPRWLVAVASSLWPSARLWQVRLV